jgi:hypothetical protein
MRPEFNLLLQAIRLYDPEATAREAEKIISGNEVDWEYLYAVANVHSVKPQLAKLIGKISTEMIPSGFRERLNDAYRQNLFNQLNYVDDFFKVRNFLEDAGIQIIPFKGFWLAQDAYGNLADRESQDVDVFVNIQDLERIKFLMTENGFLEEETYKKLTVEEIKSRFQEYNFDRMEGDKSRFHIEFHWGICPPAYGMGIRLEDLGAEIMREKFHGQEIQIFTPGAHVLLVLMHHAGKDRFIQLKQVYDIARILEKHEYIDWKWVISEAKRFNAEQLIYVGVNLAAALTGVAIPGEIRAQTESEKIDRLSKNRIRSMIRPRDQWHNIASNYTNWLFRMNTRTGLKTRIKITAATGKEVLQKLLSAARSN